jgi:hypothetical protein
MKKALVLVAFFAITLFSLSAFAAPTIVDLTYIGPNGQNNGQYYTDPYYGSLDGGTTVFAMFCDDFGHEASPGATNPYYMLNGAGDLSLARFSPLQYAEVFYLVSQFPTHTDAWIPLTQAIWDITSNAGYGDPDTLAWIADAEANHGNVDMSQFVVFAALDKENGPQEFVAPTPEPTTLFMVGTGLLGIVSAVRKRL